jgi:hypothetical protein
MLHPCHHGRVKERWEMSKRYFLLPAKSYHPHCPRGSSESVYVTDGGVHT